MTVAWWFDDVNLDEIANGGRWAITDLSAAQDIPGARGNNPVIPMREGRPHVRKVFDQHVISLGMVVVGTTEIEFEYRMDRLKQLLGTRNQAYLKRRMADGSLRQAYAEVSGTSERGMMGFQHLRQNYSGKMVADFLLAEPFFRSTEVTNPAATTIDASPKAFTITNGGTVQDRSAIITCAGPLDDIKVENETNNTWFSYGEAIANGKDLVVDVGGFTVKYDGATDLDNFLHSGDTYFLVLEPGDNAIKVTSDVATTGTVRFLFYPPFL